MSTHKIAIETPPTEATLKALGSGLSAYNRQFTPDPVPSEFVITLRDDDGAFLGGIYCQYGSHALFVKWVWIDERVRKTGTGRELMRAAEAEGRRRGARMAHLDTFNFQARGFYEKLGYTVFGTLKYPDDAYERYYMSKSL